MTNKMLAAVLGVLLVTAISADASSPAAWEQHKKEVVSACVKASGLREAHPAGQSVIFSDDVGYDVLLIRGRYNQANMSNQIGQMLCLFDRRHRKAHINDASNFLNSDKQ